MTGESNQRSALERHAQTVISVVVAGLIAWVGITVSDSRTAIARLDERVATLSAQLTEVRQKMNGQYTKEDARRDHRAITGRVDRLERRVKSLESRE